MESLEIKRETDYLRNVLYILEKKIEGNTAVLKAAEEDISKNLKYAWDNLIDDYEWAEVKLNINRKEATQVNAKNRIESFAKMLKSAYFARIDFDDGSEVTPIYIGIATLSDGNYFYVYDWRAPISSMFYDFELGEAYFDTPEGRVTGKITLKRQYKIEGDKITQIFDTSLQVIDEVLKELLASHASNKMRNIVTTIQKEQNKIIRKLDSDIMVVSGPAGSGKTSVAMHRVAYLLYAYKESLSHTNVLILSPNEIFSNYVSDVLPEIGEDNVYQTTFEDFIAAFLNEFKIREHMSDIYEVVYKNTTDVTKRNSIKLKMSNIYINLIETYLAKNKDKILGLNDIIVNGKVVIDHEFLNKFAETVEQKGLTFKEQEIALIEKIMLHLDIKFNRDKDIKNKVKKSMVNAFNKIKAKDLYLRLFENEKEFINLVQTVYNECGVSKKDKLNIKELSLVFRLTQEELARGILPYEDVCPYLYLKDRFCGFKTQKNILQVVIDEGQDYSVSQYRILSHVFKNAKITVLGDSDQCILPYNTYGEKAFETITNILKQDRVDAKCSQSYLAKTYRSTKQINAFCNALLGRRPNLNQVDRNGDEVRVIKDSFNIAKSKMIADAKALKTKEASVAIITKTEEQANKIYNALKESKQHLPFKLVSRLDKVFVTNKILIVPAYLAKGLEFDACLVYGAERSEYPVEFRNLFYVACTRALHKLNIYYTSEITPLLEKTNETKLKI